MHDDNWCSIDPCEDCIAEYEERRRHREEIHKEWTAMVAHANHTAKAKLAPLREYLDNEKAAAELKKALDWALDIAKKR